MNLRKTQIPTTFTRTDASMDNNPSSPPIDLARLFHELPALCLLIDQQRRIVSINRYGADMLGYCADEIAELSLLDLYSASDRPFIDRDLTRFIDHAQSDTVHWECNHQRRDGSCFRARDTLRRLAAVDDARQHILILGEDITQTQYLANELRKQALTDSLTGLLNRGQFERHLQQAIVSTQTGERIHTLCFIDLDQFKVVNDVCGHLAGDEYLRQITATMRTAIRAHDVLARLGGDEFGLLLHDCPRETAVNIANKVLAGIVQSHFRWKGELFSIGASIGLAIIDSHQESTEQYLRMADAACYAAKEKGRRNIQIYNAADTQVKRRDRIQHYASRINRALENDRFELHYREIHALNAQAKPVRHLEVLLRMLDDEGDLIMPGDFIPSAEYYGLATRLDLWVTRRVLRHFSQHTDLAPTVCNINLSGKTLSSHEFVSKASELIRAHPVTNLQLCLEITETAAISNMSLAIDFIQHFRALGCQFALDDFGSGFSSFTYLKSLEIDFLKLDGHFIRGLVHEPRDFALVKALHQIAQAFDIRTIAEFVENQAIADKLAALGIDFAQGYHYHQPQKLTL
jgi:diguanylate cyclase (GGDEF)-like protein/PAS domain S-box-containing protein